MAKESALEKKDYQTALENLNVAGSVLAPADFPEWTYLRGEALAGLKRWEDAGLAFMRVVIHYSGQKHSVKVYPACMLGAAKVHVSLGRKDVAGRLLRELVQFFPDKPQAATARQMLADIKG